MHTHANAHRQAHARARTQTCTRTGARAHRHAHTRARAHTDMHTHARAHTETDAQTPEDVDSIFTALEDFQRDDQSDEDLDRGNDFQEGEESEEGEAENENMPVIGKLTFHPTCLPSSYLRVDCYRPGEQVWVRGQRGGRRKMDSVVAVGRGGFTTNNGTYIDTATHIHQGITFLYCALTRLPVHVGQERGNMGIFRGSDWPVYMCAFVSEIDFLGVCFCLNYSAPTHEHTHTHTAPARAAP